jgi:hypothetical protein
MRGCNKFFNRIDKREHWGWRSCRGVIGDLTLPRDKDRICAIGMKNDTQ